MTDLLDTGKDVQLKGVNDDVLEGKLYSKNDVSSLPEYAYLCYATSENWQDSIKEITRTNDTRQIFDAFKQQSRYSHLVVIPKKPAEFGKVDIVDILRQNYIQKNQSNSEKS